MRATCFVTVKNRPRTRRLNRPESSLPRYLDPLGTAIVPSMSARRSALSVEPYGVEDLSVER
jgi:hypothetical protein